MSYVKQLLEEIAVEIGRPKESFQQFIKILEDEFFDTKESLKLIDQKTWENFKIPQRVVLLIQKKINEDPQVELSQQQQQQKQQVVQLIKEAQQQQTQQKQMGQEIKQQEFLEQINQNKMEQEQQDQQQIVDNTPQEINWDMNLGEQNSIEQEALKQIQNQAKDFETFLKTCDILTTILNNIIQDPQQEKFRTLKKSNKNLQDLIFVYQSAQTLLGVAGFQENQDVFFMEKNDINETQLKRIIQIIQENKTQTQSNNFNAFQTRSWGTTAQSISQLAQKDGYKSFSQLLEEYRLHVKQIMSKKILDRNVRCYQINAQVSNFISNDQTDQLEINDVDFNSVKQRIKSLQATMEGESFSSKRKEEYQQEIKRPIFEKTLIKIRFPLDYVLEGYFSPMETLKNIVEFVKQHLQDPNIQFYVYQTPPVQKITTKNENNTLLDSDCVPGGLFYFGVIDSKLEKEKYILNKKLIDSAKQI